MNEPELSNDAGAMTAPSMSLGGRMVNIFLSPSEVFDEVKASPPSHANWAVPLALTLLLGIIFSFVVFSQQTVLNEMKIPAEKSIEQKVAQGKLSRAQADPAESMIDKIYRPIVFVPVGIASAFVLNPAMLFLTACIVWLIGTKGFEGEFSYMKAVEAVGLAAVILALDAVFTMLLVVIYGSLFMNPGPVLLLGHVDPLNKIHLAISALDVFWIWYAAVVSIALSRLSRVSFWKAAVWGFICWAVFKYGFIVIGILFSPGGK
jgi:hypothetical protein